MSRQLTAATLAVGTEVTDGQITDRNSPRISAKLVSSGIEVVEHRAVPDDREKIAAALRELSAKVDLLFVTGGLGPTSDDFTRELLAEVFYSPLEFHEPSWQRIVKRFADRGAVAKPIQRQQCFFPRGSLILENTAGTANAFSMAVVVGIRSVFVVTLPGPPAEIASIWEHHLEEKIESLTPESEREDLYIWQSLGPGESEIAEKVEPIIQGRGLRVGYRAHLPYIEVKLWVRRQSLYDSTAVVEAVEKALEPSTVARGKEDLADAVVKAVVAGRSITIFDRLSNGYLQTRLQERVVAYRKDFPLDAMQGRLEIRNELVLGPAGTKLINETESGRFAEASGELPIVLGQDGSSWRLDVGGETHVIETTSLYNFGHERGAKYAVEKAFQILAEVL